METEYQQVYRSWEALDDLFDTDDNTCELSPDGCNTLVDSVSLLQMSQLALMLA